MISLLGIQLIGFTAHATHRWGGYGIANKTFFLCPGLPQYAINMEEAMHTKGFGTFIPLSEVFSQEHFISNTIISQKNRNHVAGFTVHEF